MLVINWNYQSLRYVNKVEVSRGIVSLGLPVRVEPFFWRVTHLNPCIGLLID